MAALSGNEQFYNQGTGVTNATPGEIVAVVDPIVTGELDGTDLILTKQSGATVVIDLSGL